MPLPTRQPTDSSSPATAAGPGEPQPTGLDENRQFPRLPFRGRAEAIVFPAPTSGPGSDFGHSEVVTSDISRGGVSILHRTELAPGQQLLLMLNDTSQLVEVCWCCPVWEGLYSAGCRFLNAPGADTVDQRLQAIDVVINEFQHWESQGSS